MAAKRTMRLPDPDRLFESTVRWLGPGARTRAAFDRLVAQVGYEAVRLALVRAAWRPGRPIWADIERVARMRAPRPYTGIPSKVWKLGQNER
jgi:hypothetical protein